jgi:hypothetical protein
LTATVAHCVRVKTKRLKDRDQTSRYARGELPSDSSGFFHSAEHVATVQPFFSAWSKDLYTLDPDSKMTEKYPLPVFFVFTRTCNNYADSEQFKFGSDQAAALQALFTALFPTTAEQHMAYL